MSVKKQLLDPLGTICKIVSLNFSEIKTKISIHNHIVSLQKPYNYQFFIRMLNGDDKENVSELFNAIIRVLKWYLVEINDNHVDDSTDNTNTNWIIISKSDEIKRIIQYACSGFRKLQQTYKYGNVILAIQYYINILEDAINKTYDDNKLPKYIIDKEMEYDTLIDYKKLRNFWDIKKLKRICELYDNCFNTFNDVEILTTEKIAVINGYLNSINSILEMAENDFQKLIENSNKG